MKPTTTQIENLKLYPPRRADGNLIATMTVKLYPELQPGGPAVDSVAVDTMIRVDASSDTISALNKKAAATVHRAIQNAAKLSLEEIERAIEHALEYDEQRS